MIAVETGKRKQILDAAAVVFSRKGYHQAKVEEIAREAEVGKGTVYEYFQGKKDLFQQMIVEFGDSYFKNLADKIAGMDSAVAGLRLILRTHFNFIRENHTITNIIVAEHYHFTEELHQWLHERYQEKLTKMQLLIEKGISRGELKPLDPELTTKVIAGSIFSLEGALFQDKTINIDKIIDIAMEIILNGIAPKNY